MRHSIKILGAVLFSCILDIGCRSVTLTTLSDRYPQITVGMTEKEVVRLIGAPIESKGRTLIWEAAEGPRYQADYVHLEVRFNAENLVMAKSIRRGHENMEPPEL